ncbi:MAG: SDR family oxidoreductase [Bradymonadaceae bacterium]|nr:SDR family oxidoreductase [Lujinxingiaceae bacterium]
MSGLQTMLLTGCASGIGRHMAIVLANKGHRLVCTDINIEALEALGEQEDWDPSQVVVRKLDVRQAQDWKYAIDEAVRLWGKLDVLMHIAGYLKPGYLHEVAPEEVDLHIDINVKGTILGTQAAATQMVKQRSGHIINLGSLASLAPVPGLSMYSASKFAVRGFTLAAAQELRKHNVYVSLLLPDAVETPMLDLQASYEEAALTFSGSAPLSLGDVERVIVERILVERPMEVVLPIGRGTLAMVANCLPEFSRVLAPVLQRKGRAAQIKLEKLNRDPN